MTVINNLLASLERSSKNPTFSYVTILLLQLKVVWGYWNVRDVPAGDTAFYFARAYDWFKYGVDVITHSPLYDVYYGWFLNLTENAVFATFAHRIVIVFILAGLVLAVMRRIFSRGIAWLLTAWWVVLPINFDAMYEIHLFALIPMLVALVLIGRGSSWHNGVALASLLGASLLVRNETFLVLLPMVAISLVAELRGRSPNDQHRSSLKLAYGLPLLLCALLTSYFYLHAVDAGEVGKRMREKESLSVCQAFSFGYQQRHPDQSGWVWENCSNRLLQVFGKPELTFLGALAANPSALVEHFLWNVRLLPDGLQLLLFSAMSGRVTPDFNEPSRSSLALPFSFATLLLFIVACYFCWKDRGKWRPWFLECRWVLLGLASFLPMNAVVILTQRPRPEYMFSLEVALHVAVGWALVVIASRLSPRRIWRGSFAVFCALMIFIWPSYASWAVPEKTLSRMYGRLEPARSLFERSGTKLVTPVYGPELCSYLAYSNTACTAIKFKDLQEQIANGTLLENALEKERATLFYADEASMRNTAVKRFVGAPGSGWGVAAYQSVGSETWALLEKPIVPSLAKLTVRVDIFPADSPLTLGPGWYDFEQYGGAAFRWVNNDAVIAFRDLEQGTLLFDIEAGPGNVVSGSVKLDALVDDHPIGQSFTVTGRQTLTVNKLPSEGSHQLRLHAEGEGKPIRTDPRTLRFRVFRISVPASR